MFTWVEQLNKLDPQKDDNDNVYVCPMSMMLAPLGQIDHSENFLLSGWLTGLIIDTKNKSALGSC